MNARQYEPQDLPGEIWKRARGKGTKYLRVSNLGRVKLLSRRIVDSNGIPRVYREQLLQPCCPSKRIDPGSYLMVILKGVYPKAVHRLVVEAFTGFIPKGYEVNHIDGDKQNNNINNLQVLTIAAHKAMQTGKSYKKQRVFTIHERLDLWHKRQAGASLTSLAVEYKSLPITIKRTIEGATFRRYLDFLECVQTGLPELTRLLAQGYTIRGIARLYKKPITKVKRLVKALNLKTAPFIGDIFEMRERGFTLEQIASAHGCSRERVRQLLTKEGK